MKVSELISVVNIYDVKISFDNPVEVANNLKTGQVMFFSPLSGFELKKYTKARHPERFVSKSAVIHIPDLTIEDFINVFECDGTGIHEITRSIIKPYCEKGIPSDIVFVTFMFLHEVGHWMQFKEMGNYVHTFIMLDYEAKKANFEKQLNLKQQFLQYNTENNIDALKLIQTQLYNNMCDYRNIPCEKWADDYAHSHMNDALRVYQEHMKSLA